MATVLHKTFVSGATSATQATAQAAFDTALAAVAGTDGVGGLDSVIIVNSGLSIGSNSQAAAYTYVFWAFIQYSVTT